MAEISKQARQAFLDELANGSTVIGALPEQAVRRRFYHLRTNDPDFRAQWDAALQEGLDLWLKVAHERATDGVVRRETFDDEGRVVSREIVYSDALLMFLIKQRDPSYREHSQVKIEGGDTPIVVEHRGVKLSDILSVARAVGLEPGD